MAREVGDADVLVAVIVCGALGAVFDWTWEIPAVFGATVVCAALMLSSAQSPRRLRGRVWGGLVIAAAVAAIVGGGVVVLSQQDLRLSREAAADGRIDDAIEHAKAARSVEPWAADPYVQLAQLEGQRGDLDAALAYIKQAEKRNSEDWRSRVIEVGLQERAGNVKAAQAAYIQARRMTPLPLINVVFPSVIQG